MPSIERFRRNVLPPALAVCGLVGLAYTLSVTRSDQPTSIAAVAPAVIADPGADHGQQISLQGLSNRRVSIDGIAAQSLFLQDRKPWRVASVPAEAPVAVATPVVVEQPIPEPIVVELPKPEITLLGIVRGQSGARALISTVNRPTENWVSVGTLVEGWEIVEIQENGMFLHSEGDQLMVNFNR